MNGLLSQKGSLIWASIFSLRFALDLTEGDERIVWFGANLRKSVASPSCNGLELEELKNAADLNISHVK